VKATTIEEAVNAFTDYRGRKLRGRSFREGQLNGADFAGADLRGADFTGASLVEANFTDAKLGVTPSSAYCFSLLR
jgi:uncharacterized protein YjbI with pentapeptide repeats